MNIWDCKHLHSKHGLASLINAQDGKTTEMFLMWLFLLLQLFTNHACISQCLFQLGISELVLIRSLFKEPGAKQLFSSILPILSQICTGQVISHVWISWLFLCIWCVCVTWTNQVTKQNIKDTINVVKTKLINLNLPASNSDYTVNLKIWHQCLILQQNTVNKNSDMKCQLKGNKSYRTIFWKLSLLFPTKHCFKKFNRKDRSPCSLMRYDLEKLFASTNSIPQNKVTAQ